MGTSVPNSRAPLKYSSDLVEMSKSCGGLGEVSQDQGDHGEAGGETGNYTRLKK